MRRTQSRFSSDSSKWSTPTSPDKEAEIQNTKSMSTCGKAQQLYLIKDPQSFSFNGKVLVCNLSLRLVRPL